MKEQNYVADLFRKDPCREFYRIIKATELAPARLGQELEDYVVTAEIRRHFQDILDDFVETRRRSPESVCTWVSGWFGSGKSHFIKAIGSVLGNLDISLSGQAQQTKATSYFCEKWRIPHSHTLQNDFNTKTVFINLLDYLGSRPPSLSEIIYTELMDSLGFATIPWVAEMERSLSKIGLYDAFKAEVEKLHGRPWNDIREEPELVRSAMAKALHTIHPETWPSLELAAKGIEDIEESLRINPKWLAKRLAEEARKLDENRGRLVVLLDEVGLYIGRAEESQDRLGELQALAENVTRNEVLGLVWLVVTAQEALEEMVPELERRSGEFQRLRDRFASKFTLTTENIEEVVSVRLLDKKEGPLLEDLSEQFHETRGALVTHACVHNVSRDQTHYGNVTQETVSKFYPFMPYHIRLIQEILNELRGKRIGEHGYTGRERAALGVVQGVLCSDLGEQPIGRLVTFDRVFDAIEDELQLLRGQQAAEIRGMEDLGSHNDIAIQSVAKTLYLLQQAGPWFPTTPENVAAVLYPQFGSDGQQVVDGVIEGLQELVKAHYVGEQEGQFRFLTQVERTFEQEVEKARGKAEVVGTSKKRQRIQEITREAFREVARLKFHKVRTFDVKIILDDDPLTSKGHLALEVFSPLVSDSISLEELEMRSAREKNLVFLITVNTGEFEDSLERVLAMEYVITEKKRSGLSSEDLRHIQDRERELDILKNDKLPEIFKKVLSTGHVVFQGESKPVGDGDWKAEIKQILTQCADNVFSEFRYAAAVVKEADIEKVLRHRGGTLPQVVQQLKVCDKDGTIREEGPLVSRVLRELTRREEKNESRKGQDVISHFDNPPYGWEGRAVRLGLAALFKHGSVWAESAGSEYHSTTQPGAIRVFLDSREFKKTTFHVGEVPKLEQRRQAAQFMAQLFGQAGLETLDEIGEALAVGLEKASNEAGRLSSQLRYLGVGDFASLEKLSQLCEEVRLRGTASARILGFLKAVKEEGLGEEIQRLNRIVKFDEEGNLDQSVEVLALAKVAEQTDPETASQIVRLVKGVDLTNNWGVLYDQYRNLHSAYGRTYREAHQHAQQVAGPASTFAQRLIEESRTLKLSKQQQQPPWNCEAAVEKLVSPSYVCQSCKSPLSVLEGIGPRIEEWKSGLLELAEREKLKKGKRKLPEALALDEKIESPEDLARLEAKIRAFVHGAFDRDKKVKVRGEVKTE